LINIISSFEKPQRYIGKEINSVVKINPKVKFLLAYPDIYEIGISHFGSKILYESINYLSSFALERVYMPWKDLYFYMKKENKILTSIETNTPIKDFDAIGFSSSTELSYTNIIAMIDLAGLNVLRDKRIEKDPIIILGGISSFNPAPLIDYIDVFVVGEADFLIQEILKILAYSKSKKERIFNLSNLEGVYVPSLSHNKKVKKVFLKDINSFPLVKHPLIPLSDSVHDRITYEIQRGCNRGCRFCQAGMIYRPLRQRTAESILNSLEEDLKLTGYRDIGFLSLNACDYLPLTKLISLIYDNFKDKGISVSLPSLRIESINESFLNTLSKLPKGGFTIAPEVASLKLKKVINKDISEHEILDTVKLVSKLGWNSIKAYFMLGLPNEDTSDLEAIIDLSYKMLNNLSSFRQSITVNLSNFIPKTHTPFQFAKQDTYLETQNKLNFFTKNLKNKRINLKWTDAKVSEIEGLLSRADERLGPVLFDLYKEGEVFTSWGNINYDLWINTLKKHSLNIEEYLDYRTSSSLVWDNIDIGVSKQYLFKEYENSKKQILTKDCINNSCTNCGVCSNEIINIVEKDFKPNINIIINKAETELKQKTRFRFKKTNLLKYLSHFEVMNIIEKACIRSELPLLISTGYKPSLKIAYGPPLNYNLISFAELADFSFYKSLNIENIINKLNKELPLDLSFLDGVNIDNSSKSINSSIEKIFFKINKAQLESFKYKSMNFEIKDDNFYFNNLLIKKKEKIIKINEYIDTVKFENDTYLHIVIKYNNNRGIKIFDLINLMFEEIDYNKINIIKRGILVDGNYYGD